MQTFKNILASTAVVIGLVAALSYVALAGSGCPSEGEGEGE